MTLLRVAFCGFVATSTCAACAPALTDAEIESRLKEATATVLEVDPAAVTIINPQTTQSRRIWRAEANGKTFDCDADRTFVLPACAIAS